MPIDPSTVQWDDAPKIDPATVKWDAAPAAPAAAPVSRTEKFLKGVQDPFDGAAQLVTNLLPKGVVKAGADLNAYLNEKTGLVPKYPEGGLNQALREKEKAYQAKRAASGETGLDGYRMAGNMASPANLALIAGAPAAATLAGRVGIGALSGAASSAINPTLADDYWGEKGKQVGAGAAIGGALPGVLGAAARVISPNASKNANLALLRKEGVNPTIGQALGGRAGAWEEKLFSAPLIGEQVGKARTAANDQFQRAAINRSLKPVGIDLPQGMAGREAVQFAENALKERYDTVLTNIGAIPADQAFSRKVASLGQLVNRDVLSPAAKAKFGTILSDVQRAFDERGVLTSEGFKRVESQLGSDIRKLTSSDDIYDGRIAPAVRQLQEELRGLLRRHAGQHADELKAANTGWANFKRVQNAAGKLGADDGNFTPAQFQNAVRALDKSKDKGAFARGKALGQDLGDAGKSILTNKVPNSGTADRGLANMALVGGAAWNPAIAVGAIGGAGMYTAPVQRALVAAATARPSAAQPAADALRKANPVLLPGLLQMYLQGSD